MRVVDLTHTYHDAMPVFPGLPSPEFRPIAEVASDGYAMTEYRMLNHIGTHVDAPAHQILGGDTLDDISLDRLVVEALVIDVSDRPPGELSLADLEQHLGDVRPNDTVLLYSDNGRNFGTNAYWTGWCYPNAEAAAALIDAGISAIGFDGPSADPVDTTTYDLHRAWLGAGCMIIENLTNLELLPERVQLVIAPMKVRQANGAPARIFALLDDS